MTKKSYRIAVSREKDRQTSSSDSMYRRRDIPTKCRDDVRDHGKVGNCLKASELEPEYDESTSHLLNKNPEHEADESPVLLSPWSI